MGNWRTVTIVGTCPPEEVPALEEACRYYPYEESKRRQERGMDFSEAMGATHPLAMSNGLCGLNNWVGQKMDVSGNLFERDFSVDDVADTLTKLVAVAPGLDIKVHCGGDWEDETCIATITAKEGRVSVGDPEIPTIRGASEDEIAGRFFRAITGGARE